MSMQRLRVALALGLYIPIGASHALQTGEIDPAFGNTTQGVQTNFSTDATTAIKANDEGLSLLLRDDNKVVVGRTDSSSGDI